MKKYVTIGNVLGLIGALVALVVLCLCKHWVLGIFTAISILAAVWTPANLYTSWVKAAFAALATFLGTFALTHTGIILDILSNVFPVAIWLIPACLTLIVAIIGCIFAWNNREYYRYNSHSPFEEEDGEMSEGERYARIIDLSLVFQSEAKTIHVWTDESTHTALIIFGDNRWSLDGAVDKLVQHTEKKTSVALQDGTLLCIPKCDKLEKALA